MNMWQKKWGRMFVKTPKTRIDEENVTELYFPSKDVLFSENDKAKRGRELLFICRPTFKNIGIRLKVSFEDIEGEKSIVFSSWKATDRAIKGDNGRDIPIHRIKKLKLLTVNN